MQSSETLSALQKVTMALEEVKGSNWMLPTSDDPDDGPQPETFLDLVKQYGGASVAESTLVALIDAVAPLCPELKVKWK